MNIGYITQPNTKGQIVIPKSLRDQVGITPGKPVEMTVLGDAVFVRPITGVTHGASTNKAAFLELLKRTKGAWGKETATEKKHRIAQRKLELAASKRRKQAW